jgi:hypothetical protein
MDTMASAREMRNEAMSDQAIAVGQVIGEQVRTMGNEDG